MASCENWRNMPHISRISWRQDFTRSLSDAAENMPSRFAWPDQNDCLTNHLQKIKGRFTTHLYVLLQNKNIICNNICVVDSRGWFWLPSLLFWRQIRPQLKGVQNCEPFQVPIVLPAERLALTRYLQIGLKSCVVDLLQWHCEPVAVKKGLYTLSITEA